MTALPELKETLRTRLHSVWPGVYRWSVFSDEKQLFFNGYLVYCLGGWALIDPPPLTPEDKSLIEEMADIKAVILTNRDHERDSQACKAYFDCPILCHTLDAPLLSVPLKPDRDLTYEDGEILLGDLKVLHLPDQKSPGESALYHLRQDLLFLGDALIGKTATDQSTGEGVSLQMLPADKYASVEKAKTGLQRLVGSCPEELFAVMVGDGENILSEAYAQIKKAVF
ncbi:MAG: hypothetical protein K2X01_00230 [Cyanobacteria bacterium]|nr:hypothetical protein [Cyanobacteriota bacterium]